MKSLAPHARSGRRRDPRVERAVIHRLRSGRSMESVATAFGISVNTVREIRDVADQLRSIEWYRRGVALCARVGLTPARVAEILGARVKP